jgi:hypothetical protein
MLNLWKIINPSIGYRPYSLLVCCLYGYCWILTGPATKRADENKVIVWEAKKDEQVNSYLQLMHLGSNLECIIYCSWYILVDIF